MYAILRKKLPYFRLNKPESEFSPRTRAKSTYFDFNASILFYFDNGFMIQYQNYEKLETNQNKNNCLVNNNAM